MRIAVVNKYAFVTAGADRHCLGLAEGLRRRGHEVAFLSTRDDRNIEKVGCFVEPTVTHWTRDTLPMTKQPGVAAKAMWNRSSGRAMKRLLEEFQPDVVHAHKIYPQLSVAPLVVASRSGVPVVQTLHDFELISASAIDERGGWSDRDETRITYRLLNSSTFLIRRRIHVACVKSFISVSRYIAGVHQSRGIESSVLPNFVVEADGRGPRAGYDDRQGVVYFGRLTPEKGVVDVVELARRLPDVPVTIIGAGRLDSYVEESARELSNLTTLGFREPSEIAERVAAARLVVVPSRWQEPGPLVPLEAMAQGTPVVAYATGGLAEYVRDSGGGKVVPVDADALVEASREIVGDEATWNEMSANALTAIATNHTLDLYAERAEAVYRSVLSGSTDD